jgi:sortase A
MINRIYALYPDSRPLIRRSPHSRMALAALLVLLALTVSACSDGSSGDAGSAAGEEPAGTAVEAVTPEEVLSDEKLEEGAPEQRDWNAPAAEDYTPATAELFVSSDSSTGAIPAVKPFNFGRDPGGPEDKTLSLSVPDIGLSDVPVYDSLSEEELTESAVHVPATGFPWQDGANTFIAGHRIGYEGTGSYRIFYDLPKLEKGDEITVEDSAGGEYVYRVNLKEVVGPGNVEVMNPVEGESVLTLQTCTLPDYAKRIIVQAELVEKS